MRRTHIHHFTFGVGAGVSGQFLDKVWQGAPIQLYWALMGSGVFLMAYAIIGAIRDAYQSSNRPEGHETDGAETLRYLLHESAWAERELRRLNFRDAIDHLEEFRRAARDAGLRIVGAICIWRPA